MAWNTAFPLLMWKLRGKLSAFVLICEGICMVVEHILTIISERVIKIIQIQMVHFVASSRTALDYRNMCSICFSSFKIKQRRVIETWEKRSLTAEWDYSRSCNMETATTNGEFSVNTPKALCIIPSFIPIFSSWGANYTIMIRQPANLLCLL